MKHQGQREIKFENHSRSEWRDLHDSDPQSAEDDFAQGEFEAAVKWSDRYRILSARREYAAMIYSVAAGEKRIFYCGRTIRGMGRLGVLRPNVVLPFLYLYFIEAPAKAVAEKSRLEAFIHTHPDPGAGMTDRRHSAEDLWLLCLKRIGSVYVVPYENDAINRASIQSTC